MTLDFHEQSSSAHLCLRPPILRFVFASYSKGRMILPNRKRMNRNYFGLLSLGIKKQREGRKLLFTLIQVSNVMLIWEGPLECP